MIITSAKLCYFLMIIVPILLKVFSFSAAFLIFILVPGEVLEAAQKPLYDFVECSRFGSLLAILNGG